MTLALIERPGVHLRRAQRADRCNATLESRSCAHSSPERFVGNRRDERKMVRSVTESVPTRYTIRYSPMTISRTSSRSSSGTIRPERGNTSKREVASKRPLCDQATILRGIPLNVPPDSLKVADCLLRPADFVHPRMRRFASSWLTVSPASAWRSPSSTLAKK